MKQNRFDLVMDHIDANISQDVETIKKGIYSLIGYNSLTFGKCFSLLTGQSLFHYINERKIYFAAQSLVSNRDRTIADIALEFGYSEHSALTRAFKQYYNVTPSDIRKGNAYVSGTKYNLLDLCNEKKHIDSRVEQIEEELRKTGDLSMSSLCYLEQMEEAEKESVFDIDTCYAVSDLAERLEIPFWILLRACEDVVLDCNSDSNVLSPEVEKAIDCGISSDMELKEICNFYNCKYYDLDEFMVKAYRKQLKSK